MERILSNQIKEKLNQQVMIEGRVYGLRKLGGIGFLILQDRKGLLQVVLEKVKQDLVLGSIVKIIGLAREEKRAPNGVEVYAEKLEIFSEPLEVLPFDLGKNDLRVQINTLFDHRPLTLRHERIKAIFSVSNTILNAYSKIMQKLDFTEIKTPKILGAASEGGANFFSVNYFGKRAYLAQSPQLYKEICVGAFERVFEIGPVFRAEKHFTSRHINEYISLDAEIGYINKMQDIIEILTNVIKFIVEKTREYNKQELKLYDAELVEIKKIPTIKLIEAKKIIKEKYNYEIQADTDIDPKGEELIGQYAKKEFDSDFIYLTHYPKKNRPFYTMPSKDNPEETESFDLIFRGLELVTGSQRIHDYNQMVKNMEYFKINPKDFDFYLEAFKYAMPPHGGWGMGLERFVYKILGLSSVKEATLFPRDVKRLTP